MAGGSSRDDFSEYDRRELLKKLNMSEEKTRDSDFETQVNKYLTELLSEFEERNYKQVARYLSDIEEELSDEVEETVTLLFGGSVAKRTYVDGISDIDALVLLRGKDLSDMPPNVVRDIFCSTLQGRFPKHKVTSGTLAVTIQFPDVEVQLLPAVRIGDGFRIADASGKTWSAIRPRRFSQKLTDINKSAGQKVIPTIKMVKAINSTLPPSRQMTGYHIESLAVEIFRGYSGSKTPKALLRHFYEKAPERILTRLRDVTGQSVHVDEYLGKDHSVNRQVVADSLGLLSRKMHAADRTGTLSAWKEILE